MDVTGSTETLELRRHGDHVAVVTLARPELLNRADDVMLDELVDTLLTLGADGTTRAIVLASSGRVFSAGGDFAYMHRLRSSTQESLRGMDHNRKVLAGLLDVPVPVVAALHGDAIGVGATIVLTCDAIVAARSAGLADPHVGIGLVAGDGGCVVWPSAAGILAAKRFLLTGDRVTAEQALQMGLVTDIVEGSDEVLPAALELAVRIAALPPIAVQGTKRALNRVLQSRSAEVSDFGALLEMHSLTTEDLVEAISAFQEKRAGVFHGR